MIKPFLPAGSGALYVGFQACLLGVGVGVALSSCAPLSHTETTPAQRPIVADHGESHSVAVATLGEASAVRDNASAPILAVMTIGNIVYPYVYGYPLHPASDGPSGLARLRLENHAGARQTVSQDGDGVVHATEKLPALGCRIEGVRENPAKYVPVSLTCELPAPKALGGNKRPVLGGLAIGASAQEVLQEPTVQENFLGAFHLTSDDFATGSGMGYFNTTHGQIALIFKNRKLARFVYYFDPDVSSWQDSSHWVRP
jgi:hypothetical protein